MPVDKTQQRKKSIWQFSRWTRTHQFSIKFLQMGLRSTFRRLNTMTEFISFQVNFIICKSASVVQQTISVHNSLSSYRISLYYYSFLWIFVWTGKHAHRGQKRYQIPLSLSYRHFQDAQFAMWVLGFEVWSSWLCNKCHHSNPRKGLCQSSTSICGQKKSWRTNNINKSWSV